MKLLQGQQLYISKHIHSQLLHEDIAEPAPQPPITRLAPCVNTISIGGVLLDTQSLGIICRPPTTLPLTIEQIAVGSFIFKDCPDKLPDAHFASMHWPRILPLDDHMNTFHQLATIHYARFYEVLILKLYWTFFLTFIAQAWIQEGAPGVAFHGDTYVCAHHSDAGPFMGAVKLTWHQDMSRQYSWADYYCPINCTLAVCQYVGTIPKVLWVRRNADGSYTVL